MKHKLSNTFGQQQVKPVQREKLIRSVFQRVAGRYDLMNDLMSMGIHRLWKRKFTRNIKQSAVKMYIDLAGGTGDIANTLNTSAQTTLIVDPSCAMLEIARKRLGERCFYLAAAAEKIPLPDNSVDLLTISFGIRNTTDIYQALHEISRVLKPGGYFYCLEFSQPQAWLRPFYDAWSRIVIPRLGAMVAGHPDAYHYLVESIRNFPAQQELAAIIKSSGLDNVSYQNLSFGIACIHQGQKPVEESIVAN